jgi:hypothetical protein
MAEPADDLKAALTDTLVNEQTKTILALMDSVLTNARLIDKIADMILRLTNEVGLIEARVSMLEADIS